MNRKTPTFVEVSVALSCANPPGWTHRVYYFRRHYEVVLVGGRWTARLIGFEITRLQQSPPPNKPLERAGIIARADVMPRSAGRSALSRWADQSESAATSQAVIFGRHGGLLTWGGRL